ncbi:MAG: flagellar basal body L-ring protein FlgH, partial [Acidobacteria bacterium]|nr:flagellar basal body L-ring protein FlgH [Acidobacteriota bacterium]
MRRIVRWNLAALALAAAAAAPAAKRDKKTVSALDRYVREAAQRSAPSSSGAAPGSLFTPGARLADLARDPRASQTDDIVTILVADRASAVSRGATKTQRQSSAKSSVGALLGVTRAAGPLASLASLGGESQLDGQGSTSRETALTTTLSARVTQVLPNGYLVV